MLQHTQPQISVIVPVWNEVDTITGLFQDIRAVLETIGQPYEILAIDDGSQDGTQEKLLALPFVRTCVHPYNKGNGAAVKTGLRQATGRLLVLMDGDGQHDPKDIPHLLAYAETHELVIGSRPSGTAQPYLRRSANRFYNWLATYVSGQRVVDLTSGFRVAHREVLTQFVPLLPNGFSYPATSTLACIKSGFSVAFVPISLRPRTGQSKIAPLRDPWRFVLIIVKTTAFFSPLKIFTPISVASIALGLLHALYKILVLQQRYTILSILFILTGVLIFCIGLVSEQIAMLRFEQINRER
jgi:glycosyltransferase involved in cell wall biosynthesis